MGIYSLTSWLKGINYSTLSMKTNHVGSVSKSLAKHLVKINGFDWQNFFQQIRESTTYVFCKITKQSVYSPTQNKHDG